MYYKKSKDGFTVVTYVGDGSVLFSFDIAKKRTKNLAGFSIHCTAPNKGPFKTNKYWIKNRINLRTGLDSQSKLTNERFVGSNEAPFQTFHWTHFPSAGPGKYHYTLHASYFEGDSVWLGPKVIVDVDLKSRVLPDLEVGFTRGYISSQAYSEFFKNKEIRPEKASINFDTRPYAKQYQWLGAHARHILFKFLEESINDRRVTLDVFSYDFNEPDVIRTLCRMGRRVRVFQDNAKLHKGPKALEPKTISALRGAGVKVRTGHFGRFSHNKVIIQKKYGRPVKVLTGSANFSIRGLYVQANNILLFKNPQIAVWYEEAFDEAFYRHKKFRHSKIASEWKDFFGKEVYSMCFSPHLKAPFSLERVKDAIKSAKKSVLFAIMDASGGGDVMAQLQKLYRHNKILSLGIIQQKHDLKLFKNDNNMSVTSFSFLKESISDQFKKEWSGGPGQVIHHKFVVCDFNGMSPVVFCGSSNLSAGGEANNGDNLVAIYDRDIVTCYAIEAIRLHDHYLFRSRHENSTKENPLKLKSNLEEWYAPYYDKHDIRSLERRILSSPVSS